MNMPCMYGVANGHRVLNVMNLVKPNRHSHS